MFTTVLIVLMSFSLTDGVKEQQEGVEITIRTNDLGKAKDEIFEAPLKNKGEIKKIRIFVEKISPLKKTKGYYVKEYDNLMYIYKEVSSSDETSTPQTLVELVEKLERKFGTGEKDLPLHERAKQIVWVYDLEKLALKMGLELEIIFE